MATPTNLQYRSEAVSDGHGRVVSDGRVRVKRVPKFTLQSTATPTDLQCRFEHIGDGHRGVVSDGRVCRSEAEGGHLCARDHRVKSKTTEALLLLVLLANSFIGALYCCIWNTILIGFAKSLNLSSRKSVWFTENVVDLDSLRVRCTGYLAR